MKSGVVICRFAPAPPAPASLFSPDVAAPPADRYWGSGQLRKARVPLTSPPVGRSRSRENVASALLPDTERGRLHSGGEGDFGGQTAATEAMCETWPRHRLMHHLPNSSKRARSQSGG